MARLRGAHVATAVAEYFRDQGLDVMLLFDSVSRFARAQREIGLASGEPPATRGYPPSMFDSMPKLLERSGTSNAGSITGFYTILVDGDDMDEPVADTVRGILDGHIVLSRRLAEAFHYPAIDVLQSISRLAPAVSSLSVNRAAGIIRKNMAIYAEAEDLINVGAYHGGSNPGIDEAIAKHDLIEQFLTQEVGEQSTLEETLLEMSEIAGVTIPREEMADRLPRMVNENEEAEWETVPGGEVSAQASGSPAGRSSRRRLAAAAPPAEAPQRAPAYLNSVASLFANSPEAEE
jgi:flagellum-specific ATP synthase